MLGAIIGGVGLAYNMYQQRQAEVKENRAERARKRINDAQEARKRRAAVREAQVASANAQVVGAANGVGQSSNVIAAGASITSQLSTNLNFLSVTSAESNKASSNLSDAANARSRGALVQSIGSFAIQNDSRIDNLFK